MSTPFEQLLSRFVDDPALIAVAGRRTASIGMSEAGRAVGCGALARHTQRPLLVVTPTSAECEQLGQDLAILIGEDQVAILPAWETLPFERVSPAASTMARRMAVWWRLSGSNPPRVVVTTARSLVQRVSPDGGHIEPIRVRRGEEVNRDALIEDLVRLGYRREFQVEAHGEFAVRGSIIDVLSPDSSDPLRIDLWGDTVDRLSIFSLDDQRSDHDCDEAAFSPCREFFPSADVRRRAEALIESEPWGADQWRRFADGDLFDGMESWLPWLSEDRSVLDLVSQESILVLIDPARIAHRARDIAAEEADLCRALAVTWGVDPQRDHPVMYRSVDDLLEDRDQRVIQVHSVVDSPDTPLFEVRSWAVPRGDGEALVRQFRELLARQFRIMVCVQHAEAGSRVQRLMLEHDIDVGFGEGAQTQMVIAPLNRGAVFPSVRTAILTEADLTGRRVSHRAPRPRIAKSAVIFDDLRVGSFVVHHHHGVAKFGGMVTRTIGGSERDYLLLEYRGDDRLYVPSDQIDAVRPYTGGESPTLSRMGGSDFAKTKARVRREVDLIAQELVVLYQKRTNARGHAFSEDTPWQREIEESFEYTETPDQLRVISEVTADMESPTPMDRLVVGDVGFGKTEITIRAAFKAVQDGLQVAVLVPTTLLAQQHYQTFSDRFANFPIRVEVLSRFLTNAEARRVSLGLAQGSVDVVIGTHRLLGADIKFRSLGLLVIDEEQRFGVTHKELIKSMKVDVDVLTLTATPIPRTLEMSLTGIRDLSTLQTPPAERQPILTYVGESDERAVSEALRRELLRDGQVFYVHNRVRDIDEVAARLASLVPEARIAIAHGQMDEGSLEQVVLDFWERRFDVLVCTTIIESGIDMPTVNTLVVDRADLLGLGQLHQLRGRVGRSGVRAYAYLFYPPDRELTEEAYERLRTIGESTELGSGLRIAMRDLEIRGAGNLLGTGQSGQIAAVGYDLYCQMVHDAIAELSGEAVREPAEIKIEVPVDASLPIEYIPRDDVRLDAYRRLAVVSSLAEVSDIEAEWRDRFGPVPEPAMRLLDIAAIRAECARTGVTSVVVGESSGFGGPPLVARIAPVNLAQSKQMRLERLFRGSRYKSGPGEVQLPVGRGAATIDAVRQFFHECLPVVEN